MRSPRFAPFLIATMSIAIATIAINGYALVRDNRVRARDAHARAVQETNRRALEALLDAETGQRGFTLTGAPDYLEPYERGRTAVRKELDALAALVAGDPAQRGRVENLGTVVESKLAELAHTVDLLKTGRRDDALRVIESHVGKHTMDEARLIFAEIDRDERRDLRPTLAGLAAAPLASLVAGVLVFALSAFALQRERASRRG